MSGKVFIYKFKVFMEIQQCVLNYVLEEVSLRYISLSETVCFFVFFLHLFYFIFLMTRCTSWLKVT